MECIAYIIHTGRAVPGETLQYAPGCGSGRLEPCGGMVPPRTRFHCARRQGLCGRNPATVRLLFYLVMFADFVMFADLVWLVVVGVGVGVVGCARL